MVEQNNLKNSRERSEVISFGPVGSVKSTPKM